jgi:riboflavin kinase, archaea type
MAARVSLRGRIVSGAGEGAFFVSLGWVRAAIERAVGFVPYPGTFNVRLVDDAALAGWRDVRARGGVRVAPPSRPPGLDDLDTTRGRAGRPVPRPPETCGGRLIPALVEDAIDAAVIVPDVTCHADDVLELVAPAHLRTMLGRGDGDPVMLTMDFA